MLTRVLKVAALVALALQGGFVRKVEAKEEICYGTKDNRYTPSEVIGEHSIEGVNPDCIHYLRPTDMLWIEDSHYNIHDVFTSPSGRRTSVSESGDLLVRSSLDHLSGSAKIILGMRRNPARNGVDIYTDMLAESCPDLYICTAAGFQSGPSDKTEKTFWNRVQGSRFWHFEKPEALEKVSTANSYTPK